MVFAVITEIIRNERDAHLHHFFAIFLAVQHAEWIFFQPFIAVFTELVPFISKEIQQFLTVYGPAFGTPDGIQVQDKIRKAQFTE